MRSGPPDSQPPIAVRLPLSSTLAQTGISASSPRCSPEMQSKHNHPMSTYTPCQIPRSSVSNSLKLVICPCRHHARAIYLSRRGGNPLGKGYRHGDTTGGPGSRPFLFGSLGRDANHREEPQLPLRGPTEPHQLHNMPTAEVENSRASCKVLKYKGILTSSGRAVNTSLPTCFEAAPAKNSGDVFLEHSLTRPFLVGA